jgi:anti-sigma factor RsiW
MDDYLDGALDADARKAFMAHIQGCEDCRRRLDHAQDVHYALSRMPVEPMSEGFAERALKRAIEQNRDDNTRKHRHWFAAGFGGTLAAGVLLAMFAGPFAPMLTEKAPMNQISMNVSEPRNLNVVFNVPEAMHDVELELELSDGLQLANRPGQQVFRWRTSLKQGKNRLPLSVKASRSGDAEVIARILKDGKQKEFRIHLNVKNGSLSSVGSVRNWI